jgi:predicted ATPase/DNA-binding SARP family transcriptional activator
MEIRRGENITKMNGKVTYRQQIAYCGKPRCRKCREGIGHGPYWYAYRTENGVTTRTYIGKHLPPEAQAMVETLEEQVQDSVPSPPTTLTVTLTGLNHASIRLFVLGQFRLERRRGQQWLPIIDAGWQQRSIRTLLGYLISSPARSVRRRHVMAALWPELENETASENLDSCIETLSLLLEPGRWVRGRQTTRSSLPLLRSEGESLILAEQARVWVDADAFENLAAQAHTETVSAQERQALLEEAATLYTGDFVPEERHLRAVLTRRRVLQSRWIALLLELAELRIAQGTLPGAIDILNHLLANDPLNEAAVQLLILALARSQRRGEALRAYQRLAELLQREYDSPPSERTRSLYEAVLSGDESILRVGDSPGSETGSETSEVGDRTTVNAEKDGSLSTVELPTTRETKISAGEISSGDSRQNGSTDSGELTALQIGRTHQSPLIGREREVGMLHELLHHLGQYAKLRMGDHERSAIPLDTQRYPHCVLLMGEAGIGKTRLAEEVSREAQQRGWTVLWSRIYAQEGGIPYRLWTEVLRKAISQERWLEEEASSHPSIYQPLATLLPELESRLPRATSPVLALEQEQSRLWDAVYQLLAVASKSTPLVIVLDDIHWADGGSCQLLAHLARRIHTYPILLIGTCRENELPADSSLLRRLIEEMLREHSVITLDIAPLTGEQIGALVSHVPNLPESMVQRIQVRAAGNPFFAEELARTPPPALPRTIAAALDHRMSRLSDLCRLLLANAAILGGAFEFPAISAMGVEQPGGGAIDEDTLLDVLDEALRAGVLTEEGKGTYISYHFWHPLLISHLYEGISLTRRTRLHRRAAEVLREMYAGRQEEIAATITHHLVMGRAEPVQIMRYAELAGDRAYMLSAYAEAERYYRQAVEYAETAHSVHGAVGSAASQENQVEHIHFILLLERLAECVIILGNFEEARHLYERILTLRNLYPASDALYEAQVRSLLWGEIERTWRYTGNKAQARACSERSEQVLRDAGVQGGPAWAKLRYQQSSLYWQEGRYDEAGHAAQEALLLLEREKPTPIPQQTTPLTRTQRILVGDPVELGRTYALLGAIANGMGKCSEALTYLNQGLAIFEQYGQKRGIAHVSCNLGYVYLKKAEYGLALAALRRSLSLAEQLGDEPLSSVVFSNLAELAASSGDLAEAEQGYKKALTLAERFNDREYMSRWHARLAAVLQAQGKQDEAARCVCRALSIGRSMHNSPCIGTALLALANLRVGQAHASSKRLPKLRTRLLAHACKNIERVLALESLEAETRTQAKLTLAHISFLMGEVDEAKALTIQVVEEAQRYELAAVEQTAQRLLQEPLIP